jgi:hypothetical protein
MRSKFAIWSDEGILSKPRATGFARVRVIIVVCSVCGIAAASVYSQIGPDRRTPATDRATGYGAEARPTQGQLAQSGEPPGMIDAYARSGATTGATSSSSTGAAPQSTAKLAPGPDAAEPMSIAAMPESKAKSTRPTAPSESTRTSPDSTARSAMARSAIKPDASDAVASAAETNPDPDNKAAHAAGNRDEKRRVTRRPAHNSSSRSWMRDDGYAGFESRDGRDRSGFAAFGPQPDGRNRGYVEFEPRDRRNNFVEFEPWDRRGRNEDPRGNRRYAPQSSPFNWFATPYQ